MDTQTATTKPKHATERSISCWMPEDLISELDGLLARQVAGLVGARPSRQRFIIVAVRDALERAKATDAQGTP